tara:strand:- start:492 stop:1352 length:861 start_codon:yes stop_codon:yes gene_type:complete
MIIVDYSGIAIATIAINKENEEGMLRHMILNSLRMYNAKFRDEYGQMILACDGAKNWRKDYYPQYKANRRKNRDSSDFDWAEAFRIMHQVREEIKDNFPYKVIHIDKCEADDIIGTLVENSNEFGGTGEKIMIVSSDGDFKQLQKYNNVKQFSPLLKKLVVENHPHTHLTDKVLKGDTGDGVPNVLSDDNVLVEGRRQTPLSKKKREAILNSLDIMSKEIYQESDWYRNYQRNSTLIDLSKTPKDIKEQIINSFDSQNPWSNKGKVFPYLVAKNCQQLINDVQEFL